MQTKGYVYFTLRKSAPKIRQTWAEEETPSLPTSSSPDPWLERAMAIFSPLDGSVSLVTSSSSRSALPIPSSSMTLRNRTKGKSSVLISSSSSANDTKLMTGNTIDDQKDEESACSAGEQSSVEDGGWSSS
ncbi:hypothetical protein BYT27DRAFT_7260799 [Phlegmacium glaucopus]|nr:hypothetical protein BYT27DRAFT_7260799 [Phlegmacium glaucopus]